MRRSLQVFDATGDAVQKIFLRDGSDLDVWHNAKAALSLNAQSPQLTVKPRVPTEGPKYSPENIDNLRER